MPTNYAVEGRIKDKLADQGVREVDLELYLIEYRNGDFDEADVSNPEWLKADKGKHAIRYIGGMTDEAALYQRAFVDMNVTAQGEIVRRFGDGPQALAAANKVAARYGTAIGSTKPGVDPNAGDDQAKERRNPWLGPDTPEKAAERLRIIRTMPTRVSAGLAKAAGKTLDGKLLRTRAA